jgi:hypothetical protein
LDAPRSAVVPLRVLRRCAFDGGGLLGVRDPPLRTNDINGIVPASITSSVFMTDQRDFMASMKAVIR